MLNIVFLIIFYLNTYCNCSCSNNFYNHVEINGECYECPRGLYGVNCTNMCPQDTYGYKCEEKCNCPAYLYCHAVFGCVSLKKYETTNTFRNGDNVTNTRSVSSVDDDKIWSMDIATWYTVSLVSIGLAVVMSVIGCITCALRNDNEPSTYSPKNLADMLSFIVNDRSQTNNIQAEGVMDTLETDDFGYDKIDEPFPLSFALPLKLPYTALKPNAAYIGLELDNFEPGPSRSNC